MGEHVREVKLDDEVDLTGLPEVPEEVLRGLGPTMPVQGLRYEDGTPVTYQGLQVRGLLLEIEERHRRAREGGING